MKAGVRGADGIATVPADTLILAECELYALQQIPGPGAWQYGALSVIVEPDPGSEGTDTREGT